MSAICVTGCKECDGRMRCKGESPSCPVCGEECGYYYKAEGEIVGCENCVTKIDAYEED